MWITVDKIQGYVGALHGNLWVRCTATYGFVARNKYENASNINALNDNSERLTCFLEKSLVCKAEQDEYH